MLVAGGSNREIADALFVSPRTVQAHLANLFGKLEVHTRAAAVARAYGSASSDHRQVSSLP